MFAKSSLEIDYCCLLIVCQPSLQTTFAEAEPVTCGVILSISVNTQFSLWKMLSHSMEVSSHDLLYSKSSIFMLLLMCILIIAMPSHCITEIYLLNKCITLTKYKRNSQLEGLHVVSSLQRWSLSLSKSGCTPSIIVHPVPNR